MVKALSLSLSVALGSTVSVLAQGPVLGGGQASSNSGPSGPGEEVEVDVYRDPYGVPHIVSSNQRAAWYALGYEQARDGLLWIQYNCRAARGELMPVRLDEAGILNDIAVHALRSHLSTRGMAPSHMRAMFAPTSSGLAAYDYNFYDNCEAYTAGANAYRQEVANATGSATHEGRLKIWLDNSKLVSVGPTLSWVYNDDIRLLDVLSQGSWTSATWSMFGAFSGIINSASDVQESGGAGEPEEFVDEDFAADPQSAGRAQQLLHDMRLHVAALSGGPSAMCGSNSFA